MSIKAVLHNPSMDFIDVININGDEKRLYISDDTDYLTDRDGYVFVEISKPKRIDDTVYMKNKRYFVFDTRTIGKKPVKKNQSRKRKVKKAVKKNPIAKKIGKRKPKSPYSMKSKNFFDMPEFEDDEAYNVMNSIRTAVEQFCSVEIEFNKKDLPILKVICNRVWKGIQ